MPLDPAAGYGIYAHVPWCTSRCPYCAFNVYVDAAAPYGQWKDGVLRDWAREAPHFTGQARSLFFGGGTPSLAPPEIIGAVIAALPLAPDAEVTLETNPGTITAARLAAYRSAGVSRISVGVQTFTPRLARLLNRGHTVHQSRELLELVAAAGLRSWSLDLIFAVPGQTLDDLRADLAAVLALQPPHVSLYGLTFEAGTPLTRALEAGKIAAPDEDLWRAQYDLIVETLEGHGWQRYEVSNFRRPGHPAVHNEDVWRGLPYAGLGPGAHGLRPDGARTRGHRALEAWLAEGLEEVEVPSPEQAALDYLLTAVRHVDGVEEAALAARGFRLEVGAVQGLAQQGLVVAEGGRIRLCGEGWAVADGVTLRLAESLEAGAEEQTA